MCPHSGTDTASAPATRESVVDCVVADTGWDRDGCGHTVILARGDNRQILTTDLQLPAGSSLRWRRHDGACRGDPMGGLGGTGAAAGRHLCYEMRRDGSRVNPTRMLGSKDECSRTGSGRRDERPQRRSTQRESSPNGRVRSGHAMPCRGPTHGVRLVRGRARAALAGTPVDGRGRSGR